MKKWLILGIVMISVVSFSRDYSYNAKRDIVKPIYKVNQRVSRLNGEEYNMLMAEREENIVDNKTFHNQLKRADNRGEESMR